MDYYLSEYNSKAFPVTEMDCPTCAATIERGLKKLEGVKDARVNFLMKKVIVTYDPNKVSVPELEKRIEDLGYKISYKKYEGFFEKVSRLFTGKKREFGFRRVGDHEFEDLVLKSNRPVVVMFTSPTCPSCRALKPQLKAAVEKFQDRVYLYEMDIMTTKKWEDYNVMSVPTLLYFKEGKEFDRQGAPLKQEEVERVISLILKGNQNNDYR